MEKFLELFILPALAGIFPFILGAKWTLRKKIWWSVVVFLLGTIASYGLSERRSWEFSGQIINNQTLQGIGQARILIPDLSKEFETEDNGNFRFDVVPGLYGPKRIRITVIKPGYLPVHRTFEPPIDNVIIELEKAQ